MAGSVSCLDWQRLTLILVGIIVDLSELRYVWYVKSPKPELGATEIDCFVVALFVAGTIRALYQVYINFYIQPTFLLPNLPKFPEKVGYKSKRHRDCPTRRRRRGYLCASSRDSAHSSWRARRVSPWDLLSNVVHGLLTLPFVSQLQILRMSCGYFLAAVALLASYATGIIGLPRGLLACVTRVVCPLFGILYPLTPLRVLNISIVSNVAFMMWLWLVRIGGKSELLCNGRMILSMFFGHTNFLIFKLN